MRSFRPIEIIGGGLAGLALGTALRRHAVPVTLREAGFYPRHRVCGEFISGLSAGTISRLELAPALADGVPHRDVAWFAGTGPPRIFSLPAPALGLSRYSLDGRLAEAFQSAGGRLETGQRIIRAPVRPGRILATGRTLGRSRWLGLKIHVHGLALARGLEMHLGAGSYVGLAAVEGGRVNVCGLFRRRPLVGNKVSLLSAYLEAAGLRELAGRLRSATADPASFCAVAGLRFDYRTVGRPGLRLGEAGGSIPPFTGNGMAMALQSAELALEPLLAYARGEIGWGAATRAIATRRSRLSRVRLNFASLLHPLLLGPSRHRWLAPLVGSGILPFRLLYALTH